MCAPSQGAILPYGLKIPSPYFPFGPSGGLTQAHLSALDFQRSQLNDYNVRVQFGLRNYQNSLGLSPFHAYITDPYTQAYFYKHDPRARFVQEEPKPSHSYIGLIGMAILNSKEKKLVLSDIYQWILDNYPYFRTRGPGWRNSIRHNLSLNDCFIKSGRSANGKGHYWAVHPANVEDFERGDFRRRRAQRKVRRHMGLSVPDDDDSPTPSPTQSWTHHDMNHDSDRGHLDPLSTPGDHPIRAMPARAEPEHLVLTHPSPAFGHLPVQPRKPSKKRQFDMASLLAPDDDDDEEMNTNQSVHGNKLHCQQLHASGFTFHPIPELRSQESNGKSCGDNSHGSDSNRSNSTQELIVDVNSTCSGSGKDLTSYDSDDDRDNDNDEIQVTSGENSPAQEITDNNFCDTSHNRPASGKYFAAREDQRSAEDKIPMDTRNNDPSHVPASPFDSGFKNENALDLSSPALPSGENKSDMFPRKCEDNRNILNKISGQGSTMSTQEDEMRHSHHAGTNGSIVESELQNCVGHGDSKTVGVMSKANGYDQDKHFDNDPLNTKSPYCDIALSGRNDPRSELLMSMSNGDQVRRNAELFQYFHPDVQDLRRAPNQCNGDMTSVPRDLGVADTDRQADSRGPPTENSTSVPETSRAISDHMRWTEMSKHSLPRDRMSAFSTLGVRNHNMYSPFPMRNFPVGSQRLLASATALRAGMPTSLMYVSTSSPSSSITAMKGIDDDTSKCTGSTNNSNNSNNNNENMSSVRGGSRD